MINFTGYNNKNLPNFMRELKKIEKESRKIVDVETAYENRHKHAEMWKNADVEKRDEIRAEIKADENEYARLCMENEFTKAVIGCLWNNAYIALMNDVLPDIINYLKAINGKQYGEKTAEKMRLYFKEKYNLHVYLSGGYYSLEKREINIQFLDLNGFSHGGKDLTINTAKYDNCIVNANNAVTMDNLNGISDFSGYGLKPYIENPREYVKTLIKLKSKARAQLETARETISSFNKLAPDGIKELPYISANISGYIF